MKPDVTFLRRVERQHVGIFTARYGRICHVDATKCAMFGGLNF